MTSLPGTTVGHAVISPGVLPAGVAQGVRDLLYGAPRAAHVIGAFATAIYLSVREHPAGYAASSRVLALLTNDAVRLPCGLVLGVSSSETWLPGLVDAGPIVVGDGALRSGTCTVVGVRTVRTTVAVGGEPVPAQVAELGLRLQATDRALSGLPGVDVSTLLRQALQDRSGAQRASRELVGRGPGLTPAGDDVLAGFLAAAGALRLNTEPLVGAVLARAIGRTPDLSAQLLRHAAAGEGPPQIQALLTALTSARPVQPALEEVLRIGHSSGHALASGVHAAAALAHDPTPNRCAEQASPSTFRRRSS